MRLDLTAYAVVWNLKDGDVESKHAKQSRRSYLCNNQVL
jgi:hypothetical protein